MRKHFLPVFCSLLLIPALTGVASGQALTADQIVEKHLTALGGRAALGKITSRRASGIVTVATPMGPVSGPLEMIAKAPNKMRADIRLDLTSIGGPGEMNLAEMFDGTNGWSLNSLTGDTAMEGDQLASARNDFFPTALLKYKELGLTPTLEPTQQVNGKAAHVILFTPKTGPAERMFFDAESFLIVRMTATLTTPQTGTIDQVSEPSDYRSVNGVQVAFKLAQTAGEQSITMTFTSIEHNVTFEDARFVKK